MSTNKHTCTHAHRLVPVLLCRHSSEGLDLLKLAQRLLLDLLQMPLQWEVAVGEEPSGDTRLGGYWGPSL